MGADRVDPTIRDRPIRRGLERDYAIALAVGFAVATGLGVLILSKRFGIGLPSLIDDWVFATEPRMSLGELLQPFIHHQGIGAARYRPSYELLSYLQWHLFGAPTSMTWPNVTGVLRVILFTTGLVLVPGVVAATTRPRPGPALLAALCVGAGLLVFSTPATDLDFLRLGTQEPMLFGLAVCGAALLIWGTGRLIAGPRDWRAVLGLAAGSGLWLLGLYYKEASIALLAAAPFLYLHLDRRWREQGLLAIPLWRSRAFQLVSAAALLPALGVVIGASGVSGQGIGMYGAEKPSSLGGWLDRLVDASGTAWDLTAIGMPVWRLLLLGLPALAILVAVRRRRIPWLAIGMIVAAVAILILQGILLLPASRYLVPSMGFFAAAALLLLAQLPRWFAWAAVAGAVVLALVRYSDVRDTVDAYVAWHADDNVGTIDLVAGLDPERCPVYMANLVSEQSESLPELVGLRPQSRSGPCRPGFAGILVGYETYPGGPLGVDDSLIRACADPGGPEVLRRTPGYSGPTGGDSFPPLEVLGCHRFRDRFRGRPIQSLLRPSRLLPGVGFVKVAADCVARYGQRRCTPNVASGQP